MKRTVEFNKLNTENNNNNTIGLLKHVLSVCELTVSTYLF